MNEVPTFTGLGNCDREPIHTPGTIQPHGFLFLLEPGTARVLGASANVRDVFWREARALIGVDLGEILSPDLRRALERMESHPDFARRALSLGHTAVEIGGRLERFSIVAHRSGDVVILEGERALQASTLDAEQSVQSFLAALDATESAAELHQLAVAEVRRITGFDRCLLYRFDADWNGEVLAEDGNGVLPSYLHHHFPASDIPRPARELYRRNRLRIIPNNTYRPVPLVLPAGRAPDQLDLGLAVLRSVSPIHLEYMRNMGTSAAMSISLLRRGELWGLLSCHSRDPRFVPFAARTACDLLGQFVGPQLAAREQIEELARRVELTGVMTHLLGQLARTPAFGLAAVGEQLRRLAAAGGVAIVHRGEVHLHGRTPPAAAVAQLAAWLHTQPKGLMFWSTLATAYPPAAAWSADASGLLAAKLGEAPAALLWFRPEQVEERAWGGEPGKAVEREGGRETLHPRKSFETWRETVRGHCVPWEPVVVGVVKDFQRVLVDAVLR